MEKKVRKMMGGKKITAKFTLLRAGRRLSGQLVYNMSF